MELTGLGLQKLLSVTLGAGESGLQPPAFEIHGTEQLMWQQEQMGRERKLGLWGGRVPMALTPDPPLSSTVITGGLTDLQRPSLGVIPLPLRGNRACDLLETTEYGKPDGLSLLLVCYSVQ